MVRAAETDSSLGVEGWALSVRSPQSHYGQSNVEILELSDSSMSIAELAYLLKLPRALKTFAYTSGSLMNPTSTISSRIGLMNTLSHIAKTLTKLEIILKGNQRRDWRFDDQDVCSLHGLKSLKSLNIELPTFASIRRLYLSQPVIQLAPLLPPNLEHLTLYPTFHYE